MTQRLESFCTSNGDDIPASSPQDFGDFSRATASVAAAHHAIRQNDGSAMPPPQAELCWNPIGSTTVDRILSMLSQAAYQDGTVPAGRACSFVSLTEPTLRAGTSALFFGFYERSCTAYMRE